MNDENSVAEASSRQVQAALRAGRVRFMGLDLAVGQGAFVPREETELLGRTVVEMLRADREQRLRVEQSPTTRVIDMCCGVGNLACAIASEVPGAVVWASDVTEACVAVARQNVAQLGLGDRVNVFHGDLFAPLVGLGLQGTIDTVVCNPPYISTSRLAAERAELLVLEPRAAFEGGPYGLSVHQRVMQDALDYLRPGGRLLFEFGLRQERQLALLFDRTKGYSEIQTKADGESQPRIVLARKPPV